MDHTDGESTRSEREEESTHSRRGRRDHWRQRSRKKRVLHTRISEQLADDIHEIAEDLRVPVSNLVRNVLEETFSAMERVSDNVGEVIEEVIDEAARARERIERRMRSDWHRPRRPRTASTPEAGAQRGEAEPRQAPAGSAQPSEGGPPQGEAAERPRSPRAEFPEVVGWQVLILNRTKDCADCGAGLRSGDRAFVGLTESGLSPHTLCRDCADARF